MKLEDRMDTLIWQLPARSTVDLRRVRDFWEHAMRCTPLLQDLSRFPKMCRGGTLEKRLLVKRGTRSFGLIATTPPFTSRSPLQLHHQARVTIRGLRLRAAERGQDAATRAIRAIRDRERATRRSCDPGSVVGDSDEWAGGGQSRVGADRRRRQGLARRR
jgi:hypothetical protein